jgi:hypothetical protein
MGNFLGFGRHVRRMKPGNLRQRGKGIRSPKKCFGRNRRK